MTCYKWSSAPKYGHYTKLSNPEKQILRNPLIGQRFRISANQNTSPGLVIPRFLLLLRGRAGPSTSALRMRVRMLLLFLVQSIAIECDLCKVMQVYNPYLLVKWCCIFSSMSVLKACCIPWICDTVDRTSGCLWYQPGELGPQLSWRCWTRYQTL